MLDGFLIFNLSTKIKSSTKTNALENLYGSLYINTVHAVKVHEHHFFRTSRSVFIDVS